MKNKLLQYLIPTTLAAAVVVGIFIYFSSQAKTNYQLAKFDLSQISGLNVNDWEKELKQSPVPHLILQKGDSKKYVFSTADCGIIKHGYKNRVELFVVFNSQGKIENVILGKNIETPQLIEKMYKNSFFKQWNGINNPEVQYVTGATYSCKAVSNGISVLLNLLKREKIFNKISK